MPHEQMPWPGDLQYAPPEIAYGSLDPDYNTRRIGIDLYLLGSFVVSIFTGENMTTWIVKELDDKLKPRYWGGFYTGDYASVLPYVANAFEEAMIKIERHIGSDPKILDEIGLLVRELCAPVPSERGDPTTRRQAASDGNTFDLARYLARIDRHIVAASVYDRRQNKK